MIWYIIGGLIGIFYLKKKYNLKFWSAVWNGIMLTLGVSFAIGAVLGIFLIITGLEEVFPTIFSVLFYAFFAYVVFFAYLHRIKANSSNVPEGPKKTYVSDGTHSGNVNGYQPKPGETIETTLAGVTFEGRQNILRHLKQGQEVIVEREPTNIYDSNAIKVIISYEDSRVIGYINKELAAKIAWIIDKYHTKPITGYVSSIYRLKNDPSILGVKISFDLPDDESQFMSNLDDVGVEEKDFDLQDEVLYEEDDSYHYEDTAQDEVEG